MDQIVTPSPPITEDRNAWAAYWQTLGQTWRTEPEIEVERQLFLARCLKIIPDIRRGVYPFREVKLGRADIEWLITNNSRVTVEQRLSKGSDLRGADLRCVDLHGLFLADIRGGLGDGEWNEATLEQREMAGINLEGANLHKVHLEGAVLRRANLKNTNLEDAHLEGADFYRAHLEGAYLRNAFLAGASLRRTSFDFSTSFEDVSIQDDKHGCALFADAYWNGMHISNINWTRVHLLGDEDEARKSRRRDREIGKANRGLKDHLKAVRANRQLATLLQLEGLNEEASRFAYRAQVLQRKVYWYQREIWRYLFSLFLSLFTGYGYKPLRAFISYLIVIGFFMMIYHILGIGWEESLVASMTAFHGRGFISDVFKPGDPQALVAAIEAFVGLLIEVTFIATLTKRLFGN